VIRTPARAPSTGQGGAEDPPLTLREPCCGRTRSQLGQQPFSRQPHLEQPLRSPAGGMACVRSNVVPCRSAGRTQLVCGQSPRASIVVCGPSGGRYRRTSSSATTHGDVRGCRAGWRGRDRKRQGAQGRAGQRGLQEHLRLLQRLFRRAVWRGLSKSFSSAGVPCCVLRAPDNTHSWQPLFPFPFFTGQRGAKPLPACVACHYTITAVSCQSAVPCTPPGALLMHPSPVSGRSAPLAGSQCAGGRKPCQKRPCYAAAPHALPSWCWPWCPCAANTPEASCPLPKPPATPSCSAVPGATHSSLRPPPPQQQCCPNLKRRQPTGGLQSHAQRRPCCSCGPLPSQPFSCPPRQGGLLQCRAQERPRCAAPPTHQQCFPQPQQPFQSSEGGCSVNPSATQGAEHPNTAPKTPSVPKQRPASAPRSRSCSKRCSAVVAAAAPWLHWLCSTPPQCCVSAADGSDPPTKQTASRSHPRPYTVQRPSHAANSLPAPQPPPCQPPGARLCVYCTDTVQALYRYCTGCVQVWYKYGTPGPGEGAQ
jgi:hypothetical protein